MSKIKEIKKIQPKIKEISKSDKTKDVRKEDNLEDKVSEEGFESIEGHSIVMDQRGRISSQENSIPSRRKIEEEKEEFREYAAGTKSNLKYEDNVKTTSVPKEGQFLEQRPVFGQDTHFQNSELTSIHRDDTKREYEEKINPQEFKAKRRQPWQG